MWIRLLFQFADVVYVRCLLVMGINGMGMVGINAMRIVRVSTVRIVMMNIVMIATMGIMKTNAMITMRIKTHPQNKKAPRRWIEHLTL